MDKLVHISASPSLKMTITLPTSQGCCEAYCESTKKWYEESGAYYKGAAGCRVAGQSHWVWAFSPGSPRSARICLLPLPLESKMALTMSWLDLSSIRPLHEICKIHHKSPLFFERCWLEKITKLILRKNNKMIHFQVLGVREHLFISIWNKSLNG